jgi:hypothetical protein
LNFYLKNKTKNSRFRNNRISTSLAIKKTQIKTTLRFYLTPASMDTIRNTNNNKIKMWGERNPHTV